MYTALGTYYSFYMTDCCPGWIGIQPGQQSILVYIRLYLMMMGLDKPETCRV